MTKQKDDDAPPRSADVVDFDALNAALGALPRPATASSPMIGESLGRPTATYSSPRPHSIPASHAPTDDPDAPAVIIQADDTIQTGPPAQMTIPMGRASSPPRAAAEAVGSAPPPALPNPWPAPARGGPTPADAKLTMPMPGRPRRQRALTVVVRPRGPTKSQKVLVFIAMLIVFVGGGIAFLLVYRPRGLNIEGLQVGVQAAQSPAPALAEPSSNAASLPIGASAPAAGTASPSSPPGAANPTENMSPPSAYGNAASTTSSAAPSGSVSSPVQGSGASTTANPTTSPQGTGPSAAGTAHGSGASATPSPKPSGSGTAGASRSKASSRAEAGTSRQSGASQGP